MECHLPAGICEKSTEDQPGGPAEDCRIIANEAAYRAILAIAKAHCPELVQAIEKEKHRSDMEASASRGAGAGSASTQTQAVVEPDESSMARRDESRVSMPAILILTFVLAEMCYLAFFAPCMPLLTGKGRCQRPSLTAEPVVIAPVSVTWSTFLNTTGFVLDIFSVYCLLVGAGVWRENLHGRRSLPTFGRELLSTVGSGQPLSVFGIVLLILGFLLHIISLYV